VAYLKKIIVLQFQLVFFFILEGMVARNHSFFFGGGRSQNGMEKFSILHEMNNKATPTITIFEQ
jgi:hypothetical protein